jgi:hypothetical protein
MNPTVPSCYAPPETLPASVDFSLPFMPHDLTPLSFTPAYDTLTPAQKLRYNQINALYFNEQTMFFEKNLARNILGHFLSRPLPPDLRDGLRQFLAEEEMHTAMFRHLNRLCAPQLYRDRDFHFIQTTPVAAWVLDAISKRPAQFPFLLWLAQLQEERALFFGRAFLKHADTLEPHFVQTQRRHLADEIGHVRWDGILLERVWTKTSPWLRRFNVRLFAWMVRQYFTTPKHTAPRVVAALVAEFPELRPRYAEF